MLSLSNKGLFIFDDECEDECESIEKIDISNNFLVRIKKSITKYRQLKEFDCSNNQIKKISKHINILNVTHLNCFNNHLSQVPILTNLVVLNCSKNKLTELEFSHFTNLEELNCSYNYISDFTKLSLLTRLKKLNIQYNNGKKILFPPQRLEVCYLEFNHFETVNIFEYIDLYQITDMSYAYNKISKVILKNLDSLLSLNLSHNNITTFEINQCPKLEYVDLSFNELVEFYKNDMTHLKYLNLENNNIQNIKLDLPKLQYLNLDYNCEKSPQITSIKSNKQMFCLDGCYNLKTLSINYNHINLDPDTKTLNFQTLSSLKILNMSNNYLTEFPDIFMCTLLSELRLQNNNISKIPNNIQSLKLITLIDMTNNDLTKISKSIQHLTKLTRLCCANNKITEISREITKLQNLHQFYFHMNPIHQHFDKIEYLSKFTYSKK